MIDNNEELILKAAKIFEERLYKTLKSNLEAIIEPYQKDKLEDISIELANMRMLLGEVESSFIGSYIVRRAIKKLKHKENKDKNNNIIGLLTKKTDAKKYYYLIFVIIFLIIILILKMF